VTRLRAEVEAEIIVTAFDRRKNRIVIGYERDETKEDADVQPGGIACMYAQGHILTREQYLGGAGSRDIQSAEEPRRLKGVLDVLLAHDVQPVEVSRVVGDVVLIRLGDGAPDVLELLEFIDTDLGVGIATPDHVLTAAQELHPCSYTEPEVVFSWQGPYPAICRDGGPRVRILVADTGLAPDAAKNFPWLNGVVGDDDLGTLPPGPIQPYGGHGTFVTGVLRAMAPQTQVHVANLFPTAGSTLESELVRGLSREAFKFGFEILHLTASCMTRKNIPPLALEAWLELLRSYKGVVCVAPAGNNHTRRPSWPGAFPDVISVGALAADWHSRAVFSSYGGWVDVYAPGEKLINAFGGGEYRYMIPPAVDEEKVGTFSGLAQWSGTSFSAPIVTGLIAARMARRGENAEQAATALLARARAQAIPGVGPVLLPSCGGEDDESRDGCGCGCGGCGCGGCGRG
jgi:hypothetical protein